MPSFATDFPIDYKIKRGLIVDVMKKLCLNIDRKRKYKAEMKAKFEERNGLLNKAQTIVMDDEKKKVEDGKDKDVVNQKFKEDDLALGQIKKLEKEQNMQNRAEEERKLKIQMRMEQKAKKEADRKKRMIEREKAEAEVGEDLILIYPMLTYQQEFWLEENFDKEEKLFLEEVAEKKKEAQRIADETKKKLEFNQKRDCYQPKVKPYVFNLDIKRRNAKGEILKNPPLKLEVVEEMEFKNQVYERLFNKLEKEKELMPEVEEEDSDEDTRDIREKFID